MKPPAGFGRIPMRVRNAGLSLRISPLAMLQIADQLINRVGWGESIRRAPQRNALGAIVRPQPQRRRQPPGGDRTKDLSPRRPASVIGRNNIVRIDGLAMQWMVPSQESRLRKNTLRLSQRQIPLPCQCRSGEDLAEVVALIATGKVKYARQDSNL